MDLSENAYVLLKAIGVESKKEEGHRNEIESLKLKMETTDFVNAFKELSNQGLLDNGKYDHLNDSTTLNGVDEKNIIINSPKLSPLGDEVFSSLK